ASSEATAAITLSAPFSVNRGHEPLVACAEAALARAPAFPSKKYCLEQSRCLRSRTVGMDRSPRPHALAEPDRSRRYRKQLRPQSLGISSEAAAESAQPPIFVVDF